MESKFCPILRAAGYVNGKEMCYEECALYVEVDDEYCGTGLGAFRSSGMSVQERYLIAAEERTEKRAASEKMG